MAYTLILISLQSPIQGKTKSPTGVRHNLLTDQDCPLVFNNINDNSSTEKLHILPCQLYKHLLMLNLYSEILLNIILLVHISISIHSIGIICVMLLTGLQAVT